MQSQPPCSCVDEIYPGWNQPIILGICFTTVATWTMMLKLPEPSLLTSLLRQGRCSPLPPLQRLSELYKSTIAANMGQCSRTWMVIQPVSTLTLGVLLSSWPGTVPGAQGHTWCSKSLHVAPAVQGQTSWQDTVNSSRACSTVPAGKWLFLLTS